MKQMHVPYVLLLLAAGESRRYGSAKQLALIEGDPMIRHVLLNLVDPDTYQIVVVLGAHSELIRPAIADLDIDIIENDLWASGISSSIQAGLSFIEKKFPETIGIVIVPGDQVMVNRDHLKELLAVSQKYPGSIIATNYDGAPGVPVYFPGKEWSMLLKLEGDEGAKHVLHTRPDIILLDLPDATLDMDYPENG
jgi:molybdenum cofactor cytidylyltransferase